MEDTKLKVVNGNEIDAVKRTGRNLENVINTNLVYPADNERLFSISDTVDILALAESLQKYNEVVNDNRLSEDIGGQYERALSNGKCMPESAVFELALEQGVPNEYTAKAIQLRYPSADKQWENLRGLGARMPFSIAQTLFYTHYENVILKALRNTFPQYNYKVVSNLSICKGGEKKGFKRGKLSFIEERTKVITTKSFLRKPHNKKVVSSIELADLSFDYINYYCHDIIDRTKLNTVLNIYSPIFLNACTEDLRNNLFDYSKYGLDENKELFKLEVHLKYLPKEEK